VEAVARHGSIRKAAEALNIASSALNRRILDLEEELGATLFERLPRGVRPTAAGELFLAYARRAIGELELVSSQIEQLKGLIRGRVNIAAVESVASEILPSAIAGFQSNHTGVRFHVNIGVPKDLLAVLIEDRVDLILTHDATRHRHINIVTTVRQTLCALVVPDHPLASRTELRLHECQGFPITLGDETLAGRALIEQCLGRSSFQIEPALVSNSIETMKAFSRMRGSVCFQFDTPGRTRAMGGDMIAIPLTDAPFAQAQLILATRRDRVLPLAAATFLEHIKAHLEAKFPPLPR
jgi:DNA-binding transcriptional LysR family regulator